MWQDHAACQGMELDSFFEAYMDEEAVFVDKVCMSCPVIRQCYNTGMQTESYGVWGGIYMADTKIPQSRNQHKTDEVWDELLFLLTTDWST